MSDGDADGVTRAASGGRQGNGDGGRYGAGRGGCRDGEGQETAVFGRSCGDRRGNGWSSGRGGGQRFGRRRLGGSGCDADRPDAGGNAQDVAVERAGCGQGNGKGGRAALGCADEERGDVPDDGAPDLFGRDGERRQIGRFVGVGDEEDVQKIVGFLPCFRGNFNPPPEAVVAVFAGRELLSVDDVVSALSADLFDPVAAEQSLQDEFSLSADLGHGVAVDRRFGRGMEQERLLERRIGRRDPVKDEEEQRDVVVPGIEYRKEAARDLGDGRLVVGGGDITRQIRVGRFGLRRVGVAGLPARHGPRFVFPIVFPDREIVALPAVDLPAAVVPPVGVGLRGVVDQKAVVRDRRLVVPVVVRIAVFIVGTRVAGEHRPVKDLKLSRVVVLVVGGGTAADLHQHRRLIVPPVVPGDDLPEPAAVIKNERHPLVTVGRRPKPRRGTDQIDRRAGPRGEVVAEVGIVRLAGFELRPHRPVVEEIGRKERDLPEVGEGAVGRMVVARGEGAPAGQLVGIRRPRDPLHIGFVVGERIGRRPDEQRRKEVGGVADLDVKRRALRIEPGAVKLPPDGDELGVEPPADEIPPAGVFVVNCDGKRQVVAQDLILGAVPRDRALPRRGKADLHPRAALVFALAALVLYARHDLPFVEVGEQVVAPVVDAGGGEGYVAELAALIAPDVAEIHRFEDVLDRIDRVIARKADAVRGVVEGKRLDLSQNRIVEVVVRSGFLPLGFTEVSFGRVFDRLAEARNGGGVLRVALGFPYPRDIPRVEKHARMPTLFRKNRRGGIGLPRRRRKIFGHRLAPEIRGGEGGDLLFQFCFKPFVFVEKRHFASPF